jgi:hypothetical protein
VPGPARGYVPLGSLRYYDFLGSEKSPIGGMCRIAGLLIMYVVGLCSGRREEKPSSTAFSFTW